MLEEAITVHRECEDQNIASVPFHYRPDAARLTQVNHTLRALIHISVFIVRGRNARVYVCTGNMGGRGLIHEGLLL